MDFSLFNFDDLLGNEMPKWGLDNENNTSDKISDKVGDAFKFGLAHELPIAVSDAEEGIPNLRAAMAYMFFNHILDEEALLRFDVTFLRKRLEQAEEESTMEEILPIFVNSLTRYLKFEDFEDLINILNTHELSDFYFEKGKWLCDIALENAFIAGNSLYYIDKKGKNTNTFCKIDIVISGFLKSVGEEKFETVLGYGYSDILGFDKLNNRVYLSADNQGNFYHCYDIEKDTFTICKGHFIGIDENGAVLMSLKNKIWIVRGNKKKALIESKDYEDYFIDNGRVYVRPIKSKEHYFCPYTVTFEGEIGKVDEADKREYLWEIFHDKVVDSEKNPMKRMERRIFGPDTTPDIISIKEIKECLDSRVSHKDRCGKKSIILFDAILEILGKYIPETEDISDILFAFLEANYRLCRKENEDLEPFPSEFLFWELKRIDASDSLKENFAGLLVNRDYAAVADMISNEPEDVKKRKPVKGAIGYIIEKEKALEFHILEKEVGMLVGTSIVPVGSYESWFCMVTYDSATDIYNIISKRNLNSKEKSFVHKEYGLMESNVNFVVENGIAV